MQHKPKFISIEGLFPRLFKFLPGWIKGTYYCVTAASGQGKSKMTRYAYVIHSYRYCKANNIPLKIVWFAREESESKFWAGILCDLLFEQYGITLTYYQLKGFHEGLTEDISDKLETLKPTIEDMKLYVHVDDKTANPTGILKGCIKVLETLGYYEVIGHFVNELGEEKEIRKFKYHNPDQHFIGVCDHVGLLSPEENKLEPVNTLHLAISKHSKNVLDVLIKNYDVIWVDVHQQEMA